MRLEFAEAWKQKPINLEDLRQAEPEPELRRVKRRKGPRALVNSENSSENLRIRVELRRTDLPELRCGAQRDPQHVRKKYACPHCEGKGENPQIDEGAGPRQASSVITLIWV